WAFVGGSGMSRRAGFRRGAGALSAPCWWSALRLSPVGARRRAPRLPNALPRRTAVAAAMRIIAALNHSSVNQYTAWLLIPASILARWTRRPGAARSKRRAGKRIRSAPAPEPQHVGPALI